jgi:response regulator RpfG family c-di-GMP phosphodiesterase
MSTASAPRILLVDDEAPILRSLARLLAFEPFTLLTANNGDQALALLASNEIAVILSDYHLPGMSGEALLKQAQAGSPDTTRILFSGHIDVELIRTAVNAGEVYRFITKPWNDDELVQAVRLGVERHQLLHRNRALAQRAEEQNRQLKRFNGELEAMVAERTAALEVRNHALTLSQEVLDGLPVAVIGIAPDGQVALANALARRLFPRLMPGETADAGLPTPCWEWTRSMLGGNAVQVIDGELGPMRFEVMALGERGVVLTAIPLAPVGHP